MNRRQTVLPPSRCCVALALLLSCSVGQGRQIPRPPGMDLMPWLMPEALTSSQYLYRVRYSGPDGSGSLRVTLRLSDADRFQLSVADTLGRSLWALEVVDGNSRLMDHRRKVHCRGGLDLRIFDVTLESLGLQALPRLLLGRLPVVADTIHRQTDDSLEFTDASKRRWTATLQGGEVSAWTLWRRDEPWIWWTRSPKGGILSHREGSQFRWHESVVEPLAVGLPVLNIPDSYRQIDCSETDFPQLRQDQSPPPGAGPSG